MRPRLFNNYSQSSRLSGADSRPRGGQEGSDPPARSQKSFLGMSSVGRRGSAGSWVAAVAGLRLGERLRAGRPRGHGRAPPRPEGRRLGASRGSGAHGSWSIRCRSVADPGSILGRSRLFRGRSGADPRPLHQRCTQGDARTLWALLSRSPPELAEFAASSVRNAQGATVAEEAAEAPWEVRFALHAGPLAARFRQRLPDLGAAEDDVVDNDNQTNDIGKATCTHDAHKQRHGSQRHQTKRSTPDQSYST